MTPLSISPGNTKLGPIPNFSLPAISTCPGRTALCSKLCYANKGHSRFHQAGSWLRNYHAVFKRKAYLAAVIGLCKATRPRAFRIHVSGDFYSPAYIKAWEKVVRACPGTQFFAFTRSWRVERLLSDLEALRALPNVRLWASCDRETGPAPKGWEVAYMSTEDDAPIPFADLVFRTLSKSVAKRLSGFRVCPKESGTKQGKALTCLTCGICWRKK
jgi:hypothetical protein